MAYGFIYTLPTITGSHSSYPILLKVADFPATSIDGTANAFANGGGDLVAYTSSAKTTQLPVEVVSFVSSGTPSAEVWVKIPTAATGNTIYLEADAVQTSQPASDSTYGSEAVWSDYAAVYHANESSGTLADATGNGHTMSATGTPNYSQTGKLGSAVSFGAGNTDSFSATSTSELDFSSAGYTLQAWIKQVSTTVNYGGVMTKGTDAGSDWVVLRNATSDDMDVYQNSSSNIHTGTWDTLNDNVFKLLHITFDHANSKVYLDGSLDSTVANTTPITNDITKPLTIGSRGGGGSTASGSTQEEIRFRSGALSADWITMEMANHNAASGWGTVGAWEEAGTSPTVDDINTNEIILDGEQDVTFETSNFTGEITTVQLLQGSAITNCTGVTSSSGDGTFDTPDITGYLVDTLGAPLTTANNAVTARPGDGTDTADSAVTLSPKAGWSAVEVASAVKAAGYLGIDFTGDAIIDECIWYFPIGSGDGQFISVSAAGLYTTDSTTNIPVYLWDKSDGKYKPFTAIIGSPDTTPDAFSFTDLTNQALSTVLTSNTEAITGIDASTAISISTSDGMEYRINGGSWVSTAGNLVVNDTVQLRVTTSASYSTNVSGILTIGGVTDTWTARTLSDPTATNSINRAIIRSIIRPIVRGIIR